jgi:nitroreductase
MIEPFTDDDQKVFEAVVRGRRSVRRFLDERVPREDVERMVALATNAASARNAQMWRFIAVDDPAVLASMQHAVAERYEALGRRATLPDGHRRLRAARSHALFFAHAPLCIAVLALPFASPVDELLELAGIGRTEHDRMRQRPDLQSIGAAVQVLTMAAHLLGYGACWMSGPVVAAESLEDILDVEPPARLVALVPIGRANRQKSAAKRLPVEDVLSFR